LLAYATHIIIRLLVLIIVVLTQVVLVIILVFEILGIEIILINSLVDESFTGEPVDGTGNELLLDVLTELVVELQELLDLRSDVIILLVVLRRGLGWREESEEGLSRNRLLNDTGLLGV
jgi:hypothetical protein